MHPQELPVSSPGVNVRHAAQENGDAHSDEVSDAMANPTPERQQVPMLEPKPCGGCVLSSFVLQSAAHAVIDISRCKHAKVIVLHLRMLV